MKLIYEFTVNQLPPGFAVLPLLILNFHLQADTFDFNFSLVSPHPLQLPLCKGELEGVVGNYKICNFTPNERLRMSHVLTYLFVALLMV